MKKILIISPNFPPVNAADMHRVRQMLGFLGNFGWEADVIAVDPRYSDNDNLEPLLLKTIPSDTRIHLVNAWEKKYTRRFGFGSLSIRSYFFFFRKGNELLSNSKYDLVFFSTTAFHLMTLGPYWKRKYGVPFVLDIQDPWRNDYYLNRPRIERPPKFWISYYLDCALEKFTVPKSDGLVAVSMHYIDTLQMRYPVYNGSTKVIPFSINQLDYTLVNKDTIEHGIKFNSNNLNIIYVGRGGKDLSYSVGLFFSALLLLEKLKPEIFSQIKCYFLGTSYASVGMGKETIKPIADVFGLGKKVVEVTNRFSYFSALAIIKSADVLFIPGSTDEGYTASKIYPYVLAEKPMISIFHEKSSVVKILKDCTNGSVISFSGNESGHEYLIEQIYEGLLMQIEKKDIPQYYNEIAFKPFLAESMTRDLTHFFEEVCNR